MKRFSTRKKNATVLSSTNNKVGFFFLVVRHLDTAAAGAGQVAGGQCATLHQPPCSAGSTARVEQLGARPLLPSAREKKGWIEALFQGVIDCHSQPYCFLFHDFLVVLEWHWHSFVRRDHEMDFWKLFGHWGKLWQYKASWRWVK